ncbi:cupin domain-containing protein [Paraburkholderia sp. J63]|uniref:cupin domain-containing protein n=1 Tax=Paraburkholderia sp. J63 TaxID=2805434 RepID=UPI002ABD9B4B|nr:cupin domain-containing protein [Paraburkholderia sp. J63]
MPITILSQSAQCQALTPSGPVGAPITEPACVTQTLEVPLEGAGNNRSGLWAVSIGRFSRHLANAEVMHILSGECTFTPTGGEAQPIKAGDTLFFPANTTGVWDIKTPLRKVYVVMAAE